MLRTGLAKSGTTDASTKNPEANLEENPEKTRSAIAVANENATQMSKVAGVAEAPCETEDSLDRLLHAREARFTFSQSLESLTLAFLDWGLHLANAPGRRITLAESASRQWARLLSQDLWAKPTAGDHRFDDESWAHPPFNTFAQATILAEQWWNEATACLPAWRSRIVPLYPSPRVRFWIFIRPPIFLGPIPKSCGQRRRSPAGISSGAIGISTRTRSGSHAVFPWTKSRASRSENKLR